MYYPIYNSLRLEIYSDKCHRDVCCLIFSGKARIHRCNTRKKYTKPIIYVNSINNGEDIHWVSARCVLLVDK